MAETRQIAERWPAAVFIEEELEAREIPLQSFLDVVRIKPERWISLRAGHVGMILSECEHIAGALHVSTEFIANLNRGYMEWKRQQKVPHG